MTAVADHRRCPVEAVALWDGLLGLGYDRATGVPCSLLNPLYAAIDASGTPYHAATREDLALGLAAGLVLAGHRPIVLMQNSGLGVSVNALLSLVALYELPIALVVSWRGEGPDAPEHVASGRRTLPLLDAIDVPYRVVGDEEALDPAHHRHPGPVALVVGAGSLR